MCPFYFVGTMLRSDAQHRHAVVCRSIYVSSFGYQRFHDINEAIGRRVYQGIVAALILRIDVCPPGEQQLHDFSVTAGGRFLNRGGGVFFMGSTVP